MSPATPPSFISTFGAVPGDLRGAVSRVNDLVERADPIKHLRFILCSHQARRSIRHANLKAVLPFFGVLRKRKHMKRCTSHQWCCTTSFTAETQRRGLTVKITLIPSMPVKNKMTGTCKQWSSQWGSWIVGLWIKYSMRYIKLAWVSTMLAKYNAVNSILLFERQGSWMMKASSSNNNK